MRYVLVITRSLQIKDRYKMVRFWKDHKLIDSPFQLFFFSRTVKSIRNKLFINNDYNFSCLHKMITFDILSYLNK